jgi:hypothetical protein
MFAARATNPAVSHSLYAVIRSWAAGTAGFVTLTALSAGLATAGPFGAGNLLVERIGTGTSTLGSTAAPIAVMEYTTSGSLAQTIAFPSTGSDQQTDSGSATSNGYLNFNAGHLSVPGSNSSAGTASVAGLNTKVNSLFDATTGALVNRTVFPTGGPTGTPPSPFSGNNFRSSIATSGSTFYAAGNSSGAPSTGGMWYFDGSAFTQISSTSSVTNIRNAEIYGGQLFHSSASGSFLGISSLGTGLPTTAGQTPSLLINMGTGANPYGFVLFDTNADSTLDLAYIADDRTAPGGGLQKWTLTGTGWANSWALLVSGTNTLSSTAGAGFAGLRGLTGSYENGVATLFTTTTEANNNRLISIVDSGVIPTAATGIATAGSNFVFRGVDITSVVPVPEPSTYALAVIGAAGAGLLARRHRRRA